ncbi:MAG TPA: LLM class flavin-dependent oxidoreductase [Dehalococcoidia bacterium]|nr:LLM class flavin-dependent oxidoreductase [Dehalococcoidia bacterium]
MNIGIGLPAATAGVDGRILVEWARRAETFPFSALGVIDRIVFPNYDPLLALSAAAAVTSRVRLVTAVLLAPLRTNTALFAKQAVTLDDLSGGRLVLGMGVGIRKDDFDISGADFHHRGRIFEQELHELRAVWSGQRGIGPAPIRPGGPEIMIGGRSDPAIRRAAEFGAGWTQGTGGPEEFKRCTDILHAAWSELGRTGVPPLQSVVYFALGKDAESNAERQLRSYYGFRGPAAGGKVAEDAALTPDAIKRTIASYEALGCDELIFLPCSLDVTEVDRLAEVVF